MPRWLKILRRDDFRPNRAIGSARAPLGCESRADGLSKSHRALVGLAVATPAGFLALVWYLENVFQSGGCTTTTAGQGVVQGDIGYKITRLRCSRVDDEFMMVVGPSDGMIAAIATVKLKPEFVRTESPRRAIFSVGGRDLGITLDGLGRPVERIDVEADGRRSTTPHPR